MLKTITYLFLLLVVFTGCESVYVPDLDEAENVLTVDARLVYGQRPHRVTLKKSMGFNETGNFSSYAGAVVKLIDNEGNECLGNENKPGEYLFYMRLYSNRRYKLNISAEGEEYSSEFETVPPKPEIDTFYSEHHEKLIQPGGENDVDEFVKREGHQVYIDIEGGNEKRYYRFDARKILQYYFPYDTVIYGIPGSVTKYAWKSQYPTGSFNIAGPPEYSSGTAIFKHPVEFFDFHEEIYLDRESRGWGWIYIMHLYGISEATFKYYKDLNKQLEADGKIFDPLYVQARNNLKCESNPDKIVLGNFEIANYRQRRFYIRLDPYRGNHIVHRVEHSYDIPEKGERAIYLPWFWEGNNIRH